MGREGGRTERIATYQKRVLKKIHKNICGSSKAALIILKCFGESGVDEGG